MFRTFSVTATGLSFTGDAEADTATLLTAIRQGHIYSTIDALATPAAISFRAVRGQTSWVAGDFVPPGGDLELQVDGNIPSGSRIVLMKAGSTVAESEGNSLRKMVSATEAVYRIEIELPGAPGNPRVPWVVTNPIYVRTDDDVAVPHGEATETAAVYENGAASGWRIETSTRSKAALDVARTTSGTELLLRWAIGGTRAESPYAAFAMPAGALLSGYDRLMFTTRADGPMRLSVQLRAANGERWRRSVYIDDQPRQAAVFFDEFRPIGMTSQRRPPLAAIRDVLFVVDTVNTKPGTSGQFWVDDVKYGR